VQSWRVHFNVHMVDHLADMVFCSSSFFCSGVSWLSVHWFSSSLFAYFSAIFLSSLMSVSSFAPPVRLATPRCFACIHMLIQKKKNHLTNNINTWSEIIYKLYNKITTPRWFDIFHILQERLTSLCTPFLEYRFIK
jgi:hypothetical protein